MSKGKESVFPEFEGTSRAGMGPGLRPYKGGLTKRELVAAMAMQGLSGIGPVKSKGVLALVNPKEMAEVAVKYADALIAELEKRSQDV